MSSDVTIPLSRSLTEVRVATALAAIGAWTIVVPYVARLLGLTVDVAAIVEVVDHVIPGVVVAAAGLFLRARAREAGLAATRAGLLAAGLAFLAGGWVLATHVPLVGDAASADISWSAAIWHAISALPIVALAGWCVVRSIPES